MTAREGRQEQETRMRRAEELESQVGRISVGHFVIVHKLLHKDMVYTYNIIA